MSKLKLKSALFASALSASLILPISVAAAVPDFSSNINSLVDYLEANQDASGKITGFGGETSWAIMGMVAAGIDPHTIENSGNSLIDFLAANPPADTATTAWERDLLAVTATGENPFTFGGHNYLAKVESFASSGQIGSTDTLNDDIFGILALISSGPSADQQIISDSVSFLIANQNVDGGWSWQVGGTSDSNDTAVAIMALKAAQDAGFTNLGLASAIDTGTNYLVGLQQPDGGWEYQNGFGTDGASTAWVVQALIGNDAVVTGGLDFLSGLQDSSGGVQYQAGFGADTFTSSYSLTALAQKSFPVGVFDQVVDEPSQEPSQPAPESPRDKEGDVLAATTDDKKGQVLAVSNLPDTGISAPSAIAKSQPANSRTRSLVAGFLVVGLSLLGLGIVMRSLLTDKIYGKFEK